MKDQKDKINQKDKQKSANKSKYIQSVGQSKGKKTRKKKRFIRKQTKNPQRNKIKRNMKKRNQNKNQSNQKKNSRKIERDRIQLIQRQERILKIEIQRALDSFYSKDNYSWESEYLKILQNFPIMEKNIKENNDYKKKLKNWVNFCCKKIAKQKLQQFQSKIQLLNKNKKGKQIMKLSTILSTSQFVIDIMKRFYRRILDQEKISLIHFKLDEPQVEQVFRNMIIQTTLIDLINDNQKKRLNVSMGGQEINDKLGVQMQQVSQLSIRKSIVEDNPISSQAIKQLLDTIKSSWYIRQLYYRYFQCYCNNQQQKNKNLPLPSREKIKKKMENLSIYFVDYAYEQLNGISHTRDPYLIFVNLFRFASQSRKLNLILQKKGTPSETRKEEHIGCLKSYLIVVLLHEIAHTLYRSLNLIQDGVQSNPGNSDDKDGGHLFQDFVFKGRVYFYYPSDYSKMKRLLQLKLKPKFSSRRQNIDVIFPENIQFEKSKKQMLIIQGKRKNNSIKVIQENYKRFLENLSQERIAPKKNQLLVEPLNQISRSFQEQDNIENLQAEPTIIVDKSECIQSFKFMQSLGKRDDSAFKNVKRSANSQKAYRFRMGNSQVEYNFSQRPIRHHASKCTVNLTEE